MGGSGGEQASAPGRGAENARSCQEGAATGALPERPGLAREAEICR